MSEDKFNKLIVIFKLYRYVKKIVRSYYITIFKYILNIQYVFKIINFKNIFDLFIYEFIKTLVFLEFHSLAPCFSWLVPPFWLSLSPAWLGLTSHFAS